MLALHCTSADILDSVVRNFTRDSSFPLSVYLVSD